MRLPKICSFALAAGLAAGSLPALAQDVEAFSAKVEGHLKKMGLTWA